MSNYVPLIPRYDQQLFYLVSHDQQWKFDVLLLLHVSHGHTSPKTYIKFYLQMLYKNVVILVKYIFQTLALSNLLEITQFIYFVLFCYCHSPHCKLLSA